MGVEQVYYDAFIRAKEYQDVWDKYAALPVKTKAKLVKKWAIYTYLQIKLRLCCKSLLSIILFDSGEK